MLVIRNPGVYRMHRAVAILYVAAIFILLFLYCIFRRCLKRNILIWLYSVAGYAGTGSCPSRN